VVLTVFDMIHERCPEIFSADDQMSGIEAAAIGRANHLSCISKHTRCDLIEIYSVAEHKITVTYLAVASFPAPSCTAS
jgi:nucleotidyltransferase/DNA polymerase involved in DNA repair